MDLGAGTLATFRLVILPAAAIGAAGRRGCRPSRCLSRPDQAPVVNVVAALLIVASIVPVRLAQWLSGSQDESLTGAR